MSERILGILLIWLSGFCAGLYLAERICRTAPAGTPPERSAP